jgi:uncharacterized caspase-like protein
MVDPKPKYERSHALIVGINDYKVASPLSYAVNDAQAVADMLRSTFNFDPSNTTILLDQEATRAAIHRAFLDLSGDNTHIDDRVLGFVWKL